MAITESVVCLGQRSACAVRVTRLDSTCAPMSGDNNGVVTAALVTLTATPDVEEGTKFEPKNACGDIVWTAEEPDILKRYTIDAEFVTHDIALLEIMTDSTIQLGSASSDWNGQIMGIERPGPQSTHGDGFALEIWTKVASNTGQCGPASTQPPYMRHIFPRCYFVPGASDFQNDVINMKVTGWATYNSEWGEGPYGDWLAASPMSGTTPYGSYFDVALPDTDCGYITVSSS